MVVVNVPISSTILVGRDTELVEIAGRLSDFACRLLTLVGPGGIGKTRLAQEAAHLLMSKDTFPNGVHFVSLQPLISVDLIVPAIAESLKFFFYGDQDQQTQLLNYLRERQLLLVLDNFEHLSAGAELLSSILEVAPGVKFIVTSRERLHLREEWVLDVGGLAYPDSEPNVTLEDFSAVQLFIHSAHRMGYIITDTDKAHVIRICRLVEGMPLAIELAASWTRVLSCHEIANEIEHSLDILSTILRNVPEKQRSMRASFEHSWRMLTDEEQAVFRRLSVFRGGFTRAAAEQVAGASLLMLAALADKSLVKVDAGERYDLHELMRQYSEEQLVSAGAAETVRDAHCQHYLNFLSARDADVKGRRQLAAMKEIEADFDNIRMAWSRALQQKDGLAVSKVLDTLRDFYSMTNRLWEGEELLQQAEIVFDADFGTPPGLLWAHIVARSVWLAIHGSFQHVQDIPARIEQSLDIARRYHDQNLMAFCLSTQGWFCAIAGDGQRALASSQESYTLYHDLDERFHTAEELFFIGFHYMGLSQYSDAIENIREALRLQLDMGNRYSAAWSLSHLGQVMFRSNRFVEAERYTEEAQAIFQEYDNQRGMNWCENLRSIMLLYGGEFKKAEYLLNGVLKAASDNHNWGRKRDALIDLAFLASLQGDYAGAQRLHDQEMLLMGDRASSSPHPMLSECIVAFGLSQFETCQESLYDRLKSLVGQQQTRALLFTLPVAALLLAHHAAKLWAVELLGLAFNHPASTIGWMERWPLLIRLRADLEAELGSPVYTACWERGKNLELQAAATALIAEFGQPSQSVPLDRPAPPTATDLLTERELEILRLIADGLNSREIAHSIHLGVSTIRWYLRQIYSKLDAHSRSQAIARARDLNLLA